MWNYDPVDITWQQDRAFKLGLEIYDHAYVAFKEPRKLSLITPFTRSHTTYGDGNCFFRAISQYLTGKEDSHEFLRKTIIEHIRYNTDQFLMLTDMNPQHLEKYLRDKDDTTGGRTKNNRDRHWADQWIIYVTSAFLKTPIATWAPHTVDNVTQCHWFTVDGRAMAGTAYIRNDIYFNQTEKLIILNNETLSHFEPADFE